MSKPFAFLSESGKVKRLAAARKRKHDDIREGTPRESPLEMSKESSEQLSAASDLQAEEDIELSHDHVHKLPESPIQEVFCQRPPIFDSESEDEDEPIPLPIFEFPNNHEPPHIASVDSTPGRFDDDPSSSITTVLTDWAFEADVSHEQLRSLARKLKSAHPQCFLNSKIDARTYFKTPDGKHFYFFLPIYLFQKNALKGKVEKTGVVATARGFIRKILDPSLFVHFNWKGQGDHNKSAFTDMKFYEMQKSKFLPHKSVFFIF